MKISNKRFVVCFFFFNDTATTEIYTLSLHDALPISLGCPDWDLPQIIRFAAQHKYDGIELRGIGAEMRSEEHTSELQSRQYLVCRLLLEKKKIINTMLIVYTYTTLHILILPLHPTTS